MIVNKPVRFSDFMVGFNLNDLIKLATIVQQSCILIFVKLHSRPITHFNDVSIYLQLKTLNYFNVIGENGR